MLVQVLQEYVPELLLLRGHKCHIRAHVLVTGAAQVGLADQCVVLPAVAPFNAAAGDDPLVHATNHAMWSKYGAAPPFASCCGSYHVCSGVFDLLQFLFVTTVPSYHHDTVLLRCTGAQGI